MTPPIIAPAHEDTRTYYRPALDEGPEPLLGSGIEWFMEQLGRPECAVLSREEEHALAVRVRAGSVPHGAYGPMTRDAMQAREVLITHNLRLVVSVAKKHTGRGVELLDLIAAGTRGLMTAVDRFDPARGYRISTYAVYWIQQAVRRICENEGRAVRLPVHMYAKGKREQLAALAYQQPLSLDEPMIAPWMTDGWDGPEEPNLLALIEDGEANVEQAVEEANAQPEAFRELMALFDKAQLTARERRVLALRYAGDDGQPMTLEQVGRVLHITRERVRQIEAKALRKLRMAAGVVPARAEADTERAELWQRAG